MVAVRAFVGENVSNYKLIIEKMEMELPVKISQTCIVDIELEDVIEEINLLPLSSRMNIVAKMLNEIETENLDISENHRELILGYLQKQIIIFQNGKSK